MKVLFLDIDGVCNSADYVRECYHANGDKPIGVVGINPAQAEMVRRIVKETGCKIVLSSTWRMWENTREQVRKEVGPFIDVTADHQRGEKWGVAPRGGEVREWLEAHPNVRQYAILDDNSDFFDDQWLFLTTWEHGLNNDIADAVIAHLNADPMNVR